MPNLTQQVFDATASTYDRDRFRLVPGHEAFYRWVIDLIPPRAKTILDLGAGTGLLTVLIRAHFPEAHIHCIDFSAPILALAKQRLGDDPRITYHPSNYVTDPLPADLCAVVSSLSIHHLDDADKLTVFSKIYASLKPNGVFVNAEQVAGPTPALDSRYKKIWLEQIRALGATGQQIEDSLYRQQEDRCASVEDQIAWLRAAGFHDADCWFKDNRFAVLAGTKG